MADLQTALRNADAAGDTEAANRIAAMIQNQQTVIEQPQDVEFSTERYKNLLLRQAKGEQGLDDEINELTNQLSGISKPEAQTPQPTPEEMQRAEQGSGVLDIFTGESRMTPELEAMPSIGEAPEFNEFSMESLKANIGPFTTGDPEEIKAIFKEQYGDRVSFSQDSKGNDIVNFESGSYALNKPGASPQDIPKFFGDLLAFSPAGRAKTITGATLKSAGGEAALEAVDAFLGGEFDTEEVAVSAVLGGGLKSAEDAIGAIYRSIKGKVSPQAEQTLKEGAEAGIPIMTSDIIPPQTFVGKTAQQVSEKIPLAGTGSIRESQQQFRQESVEEIAKKYEVFSYDAIMDSLKTQKDKVKRAAGSVLESSGNKLDGFGQIPITNTDRTINAVKAELTKPGVIQSSKALKDLDELVEAISSAPQTYTTLKENRTAFREIVDNLDPTARSQLTSRSKTLLKEVEAGMTADMKSFAKDNLTTQEFNKLNRANKVYASEAQKLTKTRLKSVLDKGDFKPESVKQLLFSQNPSEINLLYKSLTKEGRDNSRSAIINKIVTDLGKRQAGFSPTAFSGELKKYPHQVKIFFKGRDKAQLEGLRRILDTTKRAQEAGVSTPTGQQLIGGLTVGAAATDLGLTTLIGGTAGGAARLYESVPVRNALLKLAGTPKGSTAYEKALADARYVLNFAAQTMKSEEEAKE